ncbi:hypothetical protein [Vibrio sp. ED002]|uniref:hypothetical protein n=1 Tax=Vibrio sp. ED002 TaxID=2785123 RepID=UPI00200F0620|nr:hypothetical protein [Vibrio sp. ED002]UQA51685.1 hypothetical protein ITG12_04970 [Vibrio sp. ED002]
MNNELSTFKRALAVITGVLTIPLGGAVLISIARVFGAPNGVLAAYFVIYSASIFMAHDRLFNDYKFTNSGSTPFERRYRKAMSGYAIYNVIMLTLQLVVMWAR